MTTTLKPALRALPPECTVSSGTIEPSTQGGSMARRRYQCGSVILKGQVWYGKYRDDVVEQDGTVTRVQRRTPLGTKKEYPTKRLAERKLEQILCRINAVEYLSCLSWKWRERSSVKITERTTCEKSRKHYSSEQKVAILRRHLLDKVPVPTENLL